MPTIVRPTMQDLSTLLGRIGDLYISDPKVAEAAHLKFKEIGDAIRAANGIVPICPTANVPREALDAYEKCLASVPSPK